MAPSPPSHCLFDILFFFFLPLLLIPKSSYEVELIQGAEGPLPARIDTPLPFCKYLLTSLNSIASVAKKFKTLLRVFFLVSSCDALLVCRDGDARIWSSARSR